MMDPGGDGILEVIDAHSDGCHRFHIVSKSEEASFICSREMVRDAIMGSHVHDVSPESFTGKQSQILKVDQHQDCTYRRLRGGWRVGPSHEMRESCDRIEFSDIWMINT